MKNNDRLPKMRQIKDAEGLRLHTNEGSVRFFFPMSKKKLGSGGKIRVGRGTRNKQLFFFAIWPNAHKD